MNESEAADGPEFTQQEVAEGLLELASEDAAQPQRLAACNAYADALGDLGRLLWVSGYLIGDDRPSGESSFGDDDIVGLATVCQIASELTKGAVHLLEEGNVYSAHALVRQLVEVEYLAAAFAEEDRIARDWLRADSKARQRFWTPAELRKRAGGKFLREDYWSHCDLGGHPTREALSLLPGHEAPPVVIAWCDLLGHLFSIWHSTMRSVDVRASRLPDEASSSFEKVAEVQAAWLDSDQITMVIRAMHMTFRRGGHPSGPDASPSGEKAGT